MIDVLRQRQRMNYVRLPHKNKLYNLIGIENQYFFYTYLGNERRKLSALYTLPLSKFPTENKDSFFYKKLSRIPLLST